MSSVKNMRPINMHHHIVVLTLCMTISRYMVTRVEHIDSMTCLGEFTSDDRTRETGTNDSDMTRAYRHIASLVSHLWPAESFEVSNLNEIAVGIGHRVRWIGTQLKRTENHLGGIDRKNATNEWLAKI